MFKYFLKNNQLKIPVILELVLTLLVFFSFLFVDAAFNRNYIWIFLFLYIIYIFIVYIKNVPVALFIGFCIPYLFVPFYYFEKGKLISFWGSYQIDEIFNFVSIVGAIFFISFRLSLGSLNENKLVEKKFYGRLNNRFLFWVFIIIQFLVIIYGASGDTVIESGQYGQGEVKKGALFEYYFVFMFFSLMLIDRCSRFQLFIVFLALFFYTVKATFYGGRIEVVQAVLAFTFVVSNFFKGRKFFLLLLVLFAILLADLAGKFRSNPAAFIDAVNSSTSQNYLFYPSRDQRDYISSQFGDVYQSSLRIKGLIEDGEISYLDRVSSFAQVTMSYFLPERLRSDTYNLSAYKQEVVRSGGGGFIFIYSYAWLSYVGVVVFGFLLGVIYKSLYNSNNTIILSYCFVISVSFPRWYAYYPITFFKLAVFAAVVAFLVAFLKRIKIVIS
tara:strand:+ start:2119 stop:3444 length:1326 start_codon:yes stop_codon:yes gene_type:complete